MVCDYIAGCDGARGVTRAAIPDGRITVSRRDDGVAWLALLAQAPPSADGVVFGIHERGFGAHMARSPEVTRYYLQVPPGDTPDDWPHERVWHELRTRLAGRDASLTAGPLVEKVVLDMHNYVVEPMSYGRLHLAGDSAHLIAPIAAKGMNLAIHDALLLADAITAHDAGDDGGLAGYSPGGPAARLAVPGVLAVALGRAARGVVRQPLPGGHRAGPAAPAPGVGHRGQVVRGPLHGGGRRALTGPWATATG